MTSFREMQELLPDLLTMNPAILEDILRRFSQEELGVFSKMVSKQYSEGEITELLFEKGDYYRTAELALLSGADYEKNKTIDYLKYTPLTLAIERNLPRIVSILLKYGADPNQAPWMSPLMRASISADNPLIIKYLLDAGADIDGKRDGETALMNAIRLNRYKIAKYLIERGANVNILSEHGQTLINQAIRFPPNLKDIQRLLENGIEMDLSDEDNLTPLMVAQKHHLEIIRKLLENGVEMDLSDKDGLTPLMVAQKYHPNNKELLSLLKIYRDIHRFSVKKDLDDHMIDDLAKMTMEYLD